MGVSWGLRTVSIESSCHGITADQDNPVTEDFDFQWYPEACMSHPDYKGFHTVLQTVVGVHFRSREREIENT